MDEVENLRAEIRKLEARLDEHDKIMFGEDGKLGIAQIIRLMYSGHVWLISILSLGIGFFLKELVGIMFTK